MELEREGGIFMIYLRTAVWFGLELRQHSFLVLVWAFLVVVMEIVNCQGTGGCVI